MSDDNAAGFFGRWARRKTLARTGVPLPDPVPPTDVTGLAPQTITARHGILPSDDAPPTQAGAPSLRAAQPLPIAKEGGAPTEAVADAPAPTLSDVGELTPASDFSRFVARDVAPAVRNAAVKKLFSDPHFNVMDGLDIYIDDYSRPDPLPLALAKKMVSADTLGLFNETANPAMSSDQAMADTTDAGHVPEAASQSANGYANSVDTEPPEAAAQASAPSDRPDDPPAVDPTPLQTPTP